MDETASREEREREAALASFKERQRPVTSYGPRPTQETDPLGVLAAAVLGLVVLVGIGQLLIGTDHILLAFFVTVGMTVCSIVALVSGVAAAVEWGIRRARSDRA